MFKTQSLQTTINGKPVKVHAFSTGEVAVKEKFLEATRKGMRGQLDIILNPNFTEWLPVWVWVIEHPEGTFIIDTGVSAHIKEKEYFKDLSIFSKWINTSLFKFKITNDQPADKQLEQFGISTSDIKAVVLTHLHIDHVDGLKYFPQTEIIVNEYEWKKPSGDVPKLYPGWFKPSLADLNETYSVFKNTKAITRSGDLVLIHTPGHTYGHTSVLLKADTANIFFAGDICYYQDQLTKNLFSGANASYPDAEATYRNVLMFAKSEGVVFLPTHDKEAGMRLSELKPLVV